MSNILSNFKNNIDFFLRTRFPFSRKNYFEKNEEKIGLSQFEHEKFLCEKYDLEYLKNNSTVQNYLENLYTLDLLDRYFTPHPSPRQSRGEGETQTVLDIGCKNWIYVKGEHAFFKKYCKNFQLDGIEIDPNRLYSNFYSRKEAAKFYMKDLNEANYIEGDFLSHNKKYDYIIWILPFIVEYPLIKWGLPMKHFQPEKLLLHAYDSLKDGGKMLIINQDKIEHEAQEVLCKKLNIPFTIIGEVESEFLEYLNPRYLTLMEKN